VEDAFVVSGSEPFRYLTEEWKSLFDGKWMARDSVGEGFAFDELHDQKAPARRFLEPVESCHVRVIQRREETRFALESGKPLGVVVDSFRQDFDGDVPAELRIARPVDDPHPPSPELLQDLVMGEGRSNHRPTGRGNTRDLRPWLPGGRAGNGQARRLW
jgi:hypothetical protein